MSPAAEQNERTRFQRLSREKRDKINARNREKRNCQEYRAKRREYKARAKKENPLIRVNDALRARLHKAAKGKGEGSIRDVVGCSWEFLRLHLESQFRDGMNWSNYGTHWHIDHKVPCAEFDHASLKEVEACWHWSNLAPLEAHENIRKGAKIDVIPVTRRLMIG